MLTSASSQRVITHSHSTPDISYCALDGIELSIEEKIRFLSKYISLIDRETIYHPATIEFVRHFDTTQAQNIISSYCKADSFFNIMINGYDRWKNSVCFASPDVYFLLLELKLYLDERRTILTRHNCLNTLTLIEQYKNHLSFNPPFTDKMGTSGCPGIYSSATMYVPETPLYSHTGESLPVHSVIHCIDILLDHLQNNPRCSNSMEVYSFFINFKNMLFNNSYDDIYNDYIMNAIKFVYDFCSCYITSDEIKSPCLYSSFMQSIIVFHNQFL